VVARQAAQIVEAGRRCENLKALPALPVEALKGFDEFSSCKRFGFFVPKTQNHIKQLISNGRCTSSVHFLSLESLVFRRTGKKKQELIAEALNDLFAKYDVPQVRED
jgi:hypothetical protein